MATKKPKVAPKKEKAVPGYKGHRAGSKAEKAHRLVDENPKAERATLIEKIVKFGISDVTAAHWVSVFRKKAGGSAPAKKAPAKPETAKAAAPAKKPAVKKVKSAGPRIATKQPPASEAAQEDMAGA